MKLIAPHFLLTGLFGLIAFSLTSLHGAETNRVLQVRAKTVSPTAQKTKPVTDPAVELATATVSTFLLPRQVSEGRDPFFPNSSRVYGTDAIKVPDAPKTEFDLSLKGISGSQEQPLAIINTTTFTTGESNEVITRTGRPKITCVEINMTAGTVLVQIGAERRELRLSPKR
jgi:hypothetical protein